jgi:hypothetical protein
MRKFLRIILLFLAVSLSQAEGRTQTNVYHPFSDSAVWRVDYYYDEPFQSNWCFVNYYFQYYTSGDTLINSSVHKKIYRSFVLVIIQSCSSDSAFPLSQPSGYAMQGH